MTRSEARCGICAAASDREEVYAMKKYDNIEDFRQLEETCVALGNFDGVHVGHQTLIRAAVEKAREKGLASAVFTFSNHPKSLIPGAKPVKNIVYSEEKEALIEKLGVDFLVNIPFTEDYANVTGSFRKDFPCGQNECEGGFLRIQLSLRI